eukprot:1465461-Pyramimonas_sp.AAC.1
MSAAVPPREGPAIAAASLRSSASVIRCAPFPRAASHAPAPLRKLRARHCLELAMLEGKPWRAVSPVAL